MRTPVVVLPAITVQPMPRRLTTRSTLEERALQRAVKALYLPLRLWMSDAAPMQRMPCFIQATVPIRWLPPLAPPNSATVPVIHQDGLRHPALGKCLFQPHAHRLGMRAAQCASSATT